MDKKLSRLRSLGVSYPVMQAGMPGVAGVKLAAAVARAGGIGVLGLQDVSTWEDSLQALKGQAAGKPVGANLLLPYTRKKHLDAVLRQGIPMVSMFWGDAQHYVPALHRNGVFVFQQVGSLSEAVQAIAAGVDALIVQGIEAGGHIRGHQRLEELLVDVAELTTDVPVFAAGGIYSAKDVRRVASLGACGVSTGTRFVLADESGAHAAYKARLIQASETVVTTLFGLGWATPHRVAINAATKRWCRADGSVASWLQGFNTAFSFTRKILPFKPDPAKRQRAAIPVFSNAVVDKSLPGSLVDAAALYAGEKIGQLDSILTAEQIVLELAAGFSGERSAQLGP